jgi:hypothetical protein
MYKKNLNILPTRLFASDLLFSSISSFLWGWKQTCQRGFRPASQWWKVEKEIDILLFRARVFFLADMAAIGYPPVLPVVAGIEPVLDLVVGAIVVVL